MLNGSDKPSAMGIGPAGSFRRDLPITPLGDDNLDPELALPEGRTDRPVRSAEALRSLQSSKFTALLHSKFSNLQKCNRRAQPHKSHPFRRARRPAGKTDLIAQAGSGATGPPLSICSVSVQRPGRLAADRRGGWRFGCGALGQLRADRPGPPRQFLPAAETGFRFDREQRLQ